MHTSANESSRCQVAGQTSYGILSGYVHRYRSRVDWLNSVYRSRVVGGDLVSQRLVKGYQGGYPPIWRCTGMSAGT